MKIIKLKERQKNWSAKVNSFYLKTRKNDASSY